VVCSVDDEPLETCEDQIIKRLLLRPFRVGKSVLVLCTINLVGFDAFLFAADDEYPQRFGHFTRFDCGPIPLVIQILAGDFAQKGDIEWLGGER